MATLREILGDYQLQPGSSVPKDNPLTGTVEYYNTVWMITRGEMNEPKCNTARKQLEAIGYVVLEVKVDHVLKRTLFRVRTGPVIKRKRD